MVWFSKAGANALAIVMVPTIKNVPFKIRTFLSRIQIVFDRIGHLFGIQTVRLPEFRSHSKLEAVAKQPLVDHSKPQYMI